jgi:hypothetical protein
VKIKLMLTAALTVVTGLLSGCANYAHQCQELGFEPGSDRAAECALQLRHDHNVSSGNAVAAYLLFH